jgi:hypothetical protein
MNRNLFLPLILISTLAGCAQQQTKTREITVVKLDKLPASAKKKGPTQKFTAQVNLTPGKLKPRMVEIYDIGPTVDSNGNLVGEHKYYKVVETERWTYIPHTPATFPAFKQGKPKVQEADAVDQAKRVMEELKAATAQARSQIPAVQPVANPGPGGNATAEAPLPQTEGLSPVQSEVDTALSPERQQALKTFDQQAQQP